MYDQLINASKLINWQHSSILLISISLILWSISLYFSKFEISDYGLIGGLNPLYFASISLIGISFFFTIKKNSENTLLPVLHLLCLVLMTSLIPVLIEGTPRFPYNFETSRSIDFILQNGHINTNIINYQNWPAIFYFGAVITLLAGISPLYQVLIIPLILMVILIPFYYLFYSTFLARKEIFTVFLLSNILFFSSPIYYVPGVLGTIMITFAILIILRFYYLNERQSLGTGIIFIIFSFVAVMSHFLSTVYIIMTLVALFILSIFFKKRSDKKFVFVAVLFMFWQIYVAGSYSLSIIGTSMKTALNLDLTISEAKELGFSGTQEHINAVNIRLFSSLSLIILASIGFLYEIVYKRIITFKSLSLPTWIGANSSVALITSYSGEILGRTFSVSSDLLAMLASKIINHKYLSLILVLIIFIGPPISIINAYGNEKIDYVSPAEINGANFLFDHVSHPINITSFEKRVWIFRYSPNVKWIEFKLDKTQNYENDTNYVLIGERDLNSHIFLNGFIDIQNLTEMENSNSFNKIYQSQNFTLLIGGKN